MHAIFSNRIYGRSAATAVFVLALSLSLAGQSRLVALTNPAAVPVAVDLNSSLFDATRVAAATDRDLANSNLEGGTVQRLEFWRRQRAHKAQTAASVRRNLELAVPNLVRDVENSHGSISSTFKLYNDLNLVCESLESLVSSGGQAGKSKYPALSTDLSEMNRLREQLSSHIQYTAAVLERNHPELALSGHPKKIIIDDDDVPVRRKRHTSPQ